MEFEPQQELAIATIVGVENLPADMLGQKAIFTVKGEPQTANIQLPGGGKLAWLDEQLTEPVKDALTTGTFRIAKLTNPRQPEQKATIMIDPYLAPHELIILGGGHIAQPLVKIGRLLGYRITVIDDRPDFGLKDLLSEDDRSVCCSFSDIEKVLNLGPSSHVVIITRGHLHDLECLRTVIKYPLGYLGMIGSRRKVKLVRDTLLQEGVEEAKVDKVHMPIGLRINAKTPAEIAVSIAAELIMVRRSHEGDSGELISSVDREATTKALAASERGVPATLATIVRSQGSTPRKEGARMLIYRDGQTFGTIGGGCAEAEVRREALTVIDNEKPALYKVSLTADIAAMEGMACGGMLDVFIEPVKNFTILRNEQARE